MMPAQGWNGPVQGRPVAMGNAGGYVPPRLKTPSSIVARGKIEEEPAPVAAAPPAPTWKASPVAVTDPVVALAIPKPGELGVRAAPTPEDWTTSLVRLESLGACDFRAHEEQTGGWMFVCKLRTADPSKRHRIETGPTATKAEAIRLALAEAERVTRR